MPITCLLVLQIPYHTYIPTIILMLLCISMNLNPWSQTISHFLKTHLIGPASSHQPLKNLRERRSTDLPLPDMYTITREEGEGMETTDTESVSSSGTHTQSLEQLLNSPETKLGRSLSFGMFFLFSSVVPSNKS